MMSATWDAIGTELALLALFCAGFVLFRIAAVQRICFGPQKWADDGSAKNAAGIDGDARTVPAWIIPAKQLEANWAAGRADLVLSAWPSLEHFTIGSLKAVIEALVSVQKQAD